MNSTPICKHPNNPHYFLFRGQPTILVTSAEHYGAVVNLDFDYIPYLDVLASYGLNYTRIYAGAYLEPEHYFIQDNTLGPRVGRHCLPWRRSYQPSSELPGYPYGGNLFDLDQWNPEYFDRLEEFIAQAGQRGIVVEICMFNAMYPDTWSSMPLYHANNIQQVGCGACSDFQTLKEPALVARQVDYVCKITEAVNRFDNVVLEICDEPGIHGTQPEDYAPWLATLAKEIAEMEARLPNQHLIAQQVCGPPGGLGDLSSDPHISLLVGQYIGETGGGQIGGVMLLDAYDDLDKPIELNETAYYPIWYEGDKVAASRVEAWEFILGGGAGFNHLNGLFSTINPTAEGTGNEPVLQSLKNLMDFIQRLDFVSMRRHPGLVSGGLPEGFLARSISEPGRQYALYLHHSKLPDGGKYVVQPGDFQLMLELALSPGNYRLEWVDPASGSVILVEETDHTGGTGRFSTPNFMIDLALRITRR